MTTGTGWTTHVERERQALAAKYAKRLGPRTLEERRLLEELTTRVAFTRGANERAAERKYSCYEEFVLEHGRFYRHADLPDELEYGPLQQCYSNAFEWANDLSTVVYVEGFASSLISVQHAWVADAFETDDPAALDVTWRYEADRKRAYLGIAFDTQFVRSIIIKQGVYGVIGGDPYATHTLFDLGLEEAAEGQYSFAPVYCAYGDGSAPVITQADLMRLEDDEDDEIDED